MTAGFTKVTYNGVSIEQCVTRRFSQEPVFDPSDTDLLYYKFTIRVSGFVHGHTDWTSVGTSGVTGVTQDAASYERHLRYKLLENRQNFEMRMGVTAQADGTVLLAAKPVPSEASPRVMTGYDLNNGPRCRMLEITHVTGNEIFKIEAEFEVCVMECDAEGNVPNGTGVLSNRWSCVDEVDTNFFTTRTYDGLLRTFSGQINPNAFRAYVVPPLQPGLRRERMLFSVTEDGLTMRYTVVDKEVAFSAPHPATNWSYKYTESLTNDAHANGELSIMLEGDRDCDKKALVKIAAGMINARLIGFGPARPGDIKDNSFVEFLSFSEESGSSTTNRILASARVKRTHERVVRERFVGFRMGKPIDWQDFNNVIPDYDANLSRGSRPDETVELEGPISMVGAFAAYLQRPCSDKHRVSDSGFVPGVSVADGETDVARLGARADIDARVVPTAADLPAEYMSQSHLQAMYVHWQLDCSVHVQSGKVALPIARSAISRTEGRDNSVAVVSLHPPIAKRTVRLAGERVGQRPELPEARSFQDSNGITHHLMDTRVKPASATRTPDGRLYYRVDAEYEYVLSRPPTVNENLEVGSTPWDVLGIQTANINYAEVVEESPITRATGQETGREITLVPPDQA